jgi:hypothetical protein
MLGTDTTEARRTDDPAKVHAQGWLATTVKTQSAFVLLCLAVGCATRAPKSGGLSAYRQCDLRKLDTEALAAFAGEFNALTGDELEHKHLPGAFVPWSVAPIKSDHAAWVFIEGYEGYPHPGMSAMRVHVFDANWRRLRNQTVPTGYRLRLVDVTIERNAALAQDLLVVKVAPFLSGLVGKEGPTPRRVWFQKQYYCLARDGLVLVRLEDSRGGLAQNDYRWHPIGPPAPRRTEDQWVYSLESPDVASRLAALVWLTGLHLPSAQERKDSDNSESVEDSRLFESVRDDARAKRILRELRKHKNTWVKEYAELGLLRSSGDADRKSTQQDQPTDDDSVPGAPTPEDGD